MMASIDVQTTTKNSEKQLLFKNITVKDKQIAQNLPNLKRSYAQIVQKNQFRTFEFEKLNIIK